MQRPLLLNGFMGSGKSSIGPRVAALAGRAFVDLDQRIEARAGMPIPNIFAERQEAGFRRLEAEVLSELLSHSQAEPPVIALGGGALSSRAMRLKALERAVVVTLEASPKELLKRVGGGRTRPLLAGFSDPEARIMELLELRQRAYAEAHARVRTDGKSLDSVAEAVLEIWRRDPVAVAAGEQSYSVEIGRALLGRLGSLTAGASRVILVSDETVWRLHGAAARAALAQGPMSPIVVELVPGEEHKRVDAVERIWRAALAGGADRSSLFVALGGGVVSDITGFAAATYMRGVPWVSVPTTLLAMVDASVGGKTGVDLEAAKNAVGAFHQPRAVLCDVDLLSTEAERGFRGALAEVVKTALIGDRALLDRLEADAARLSERAPEFLVDVVRRSIRVKARIVSQDERESGLRAVLNLGHTIGHALEAHAGYGRLSHGEAISLGLVAALRMGVRLGVTDPALARRIQSLLERLGLPTDLAQEPVAAAVELVGHDKKRAGKRLRFVITRDVEAVDLVELELEQIKTLAREVAQLHE